MYNFFYDETEHSRKINYSTVTANNYYDNFISVIVGWSVEEEKNITEKYLAFESKYESRKKKGELKSQTMKVNDFKYGLASMNKHVLEFYYDLISLYNENIIIYFSVTSKIEYVIHQIFMNYHSNMFMDIDSMKYSIIKAINVYRPVKVLEAIYKEPQVFVNELRDFLKKQINKNQANIVLKEYENQAFEQILMILDDTEAPKSLDWTYLSSFNGFSKLLREMKVVDYRLIIDREGGESKTLHSAKLVGLKNVTEGDSKAYVGIRMADMLAGLISKLLQSLNVALRGDYKGCEIRKKLLTSDWFDLNQRQLNLYKKLYQVICVNNDYWYKSYAGLYFDDLVAFVTLLQFMNNFRGVYDIRKKFDMQSEYYNAFVCDRIQERYQLIHNKLPIEPIDKNYEDYYNQRGAKIYKNPERQTMLPLDEGQNRYNVLSVGLVPNGIPLVTVLENAKPVCYRLPGDYSEWAMMVIGLANMGERLFPQEVIFSLIGGKYYVDIL